MTTLKNIYAHLLARAQATHEWQQAELRGGAYVSVGCTEGVTHVIFSRAGKRLGDVELTTFRQHCGVPDGARRTPEDRTIQGTKQTEAGPRWFVGFSWKDGG